MKKQTAKPKTPKSKDALRKEVLRVATHVRAGGEGSDDDGSGDG